jgi:hypothetical protein
MIFCVFEGVGNNMDRHAVSCGVIWTLDLQNHMTLLNTPCLCRKQSVLEVSAGEHVISTGPVTIKFTSPY